MKIKLILFISVLNFYYFTAQVKAKDTVKLQEVIVTATKTKRQLSNITVPVILIKSKDIELGSTMNLQNILTEFTGLEMSSSALGVGIQLQGLDPSYTLIMIDSQPLAGRLNGTLDLSRLSVENIEQIEIVKGPSSVLYGSEALAGVVNIITKKSKKNDLSIKTKISSFDTYNFSTNASIIKKKIKISFFANYYTTRGYDLASSYEGYNLSDEYYGKTVSPHSNYTISFNLQYNISKKLSFELNSRYFSEEQKYKFLEAGSNKINGLGTIEDWNITPSLKYDFSNKLKSTVKVYATNYKTNATETNQNESIYSATFFNEKYTNIEFQNDYSINKSHSVTLGFGYAQESVATSKLNSDDLHTANNSYLFAQYLFDYNKKLHLVFGARFDKHDAYTNQFNPKLSVLYRILPSFNIRVSAGRGFKKPNFKQLYFNYTNNAVGYTVLGTTFVEQGIENLLNSNQIAIDPETNQPVIYDLYYQIKNSNGIIKPESSYGYNLGFKITAINKTIIDIDFFKNDLENLIDINPIALKTNGWQAYSYQNLSRVFSQGVTIDVKYRISEKFKISAGYQYAETKDKNVLEKIKGDGVFAQDPITLTSYKVTAKDYGGLLNRSKHLANIKIIGSDIYKGIDASFRVNYKGKYGFADFNNNQILDIDREYTKAYYLFNTTISKSFFKDKLKLHVGVDNIADFTYATADYTISTLPGRTFFTTINYKF